jgi:hypothetical protein
MRWTGQPRRMGLDGLLTPGAIRDYCGRGFVLQQALSSHAMRACSPTYSTSANDY